MVWQGCPPHLTKNKNTLSPARNIRRTGRNMIQASIIITAHVFNMLAKRIDV